MILAKRLSEKQKEQLTLSFTEGKTIDFLSKEYGRSKLTITRNLKKYLGENKFKVLMDKKKSIEEFINHNDKFDVGDLNNQENLDISNKNLLNKNTLVHNSSEEELFPITEFMEITPLNEEIDNAPRKDFSTISIADINLPNTVYMIVDKKIELETRLLKNFPEWQFLSLEDMDRVVIQIYYDLKTAKRNCNIEQKVIKVPNTNVFKIVSPILKSRGITRIISEDQLIAL